MFFFENHGYIDDIPVLATDWLRFNLVGPSPMVMRRECYVRNRQDRNMQSSLITRFRTTILLIHHWRACPNVEYALLRASALPSFRLLDDADVSGYVPWR